MKSIRPFFLKEEVLPNVNGFNLLRNYVNKGYVNFSNIAKIGINPQAEDRQNPRGFYGFPITPDLLENLMYQHWRGGNSWTTRKYMIVFTINPQANIISFNNAASFKEWISQYAPTVDRYVGGAKLTKLLQQQGYDGMSAKSFALSGDIEEEVVLFPPYQGKLTVVDILLNNLKYEALIYKLERDKRSVSKSDRVRIQRDIDAVQQILRKQKQNIG